jgi:hypothetical protein
VIAENFVAEDLLCNQSIDLLCHFKEAKAQLFFISLLVISQVHQDRLIMNYLILNLLIKGIHFMTHHVSLVVFIVDTSMNIWRMHLIVK